MEQLINGPAKATSSAQELTSVRCEQSSGNPGILIIDQWRHIKDVEDAADNGTRRLSIEGLREPVWLNGPVWLQKDKDEWPKPWWQENEVQPEQAISAAATDKLLQTH